MGAHLPLKSISDKTRVGRGQKGASRRPPVVWRRSAGGPRLNFSHPSLHGILSQQTVCTPSPFCYGTNFSRRL